MISSDDEAAIKKLGPAFEAAWNAHDMKAFGSLFTPTVDFVVVSGAWFEGRDPVVAYHAERHATNFKDSIWQTGRMTLRPLSPDFCLVHMNWSISGDRNRDETLRQPRSGIFTWVVQRGQAGWLIDAAHNTNVEQRVGDERDRKSLS